MIAEIAGRQHGNVTRDQLLTAGVTRHEIAWRAKTGALIPVFRGVYRVGHQAPNIHASYMAAVLACGDGALLSGHAAAHLLGIARRPPSAPAVLARTERRIEGIKTVRMRRERSGTLWLGIPVTTPAETLVDLAASETDEDLARACHEAGVKHRTTPAQVEAVLGRAKGAAKLRRILRGDTRVTLSVLERTFINGLKQRNLPLPVTNKPAGSKRVDCRWPDHNLTVELDSYQFHNSRYSWEQDRKREREAHARGDHFRRFTYEDVFDRPGPMYAQIAALTG